MNETKKNYTVGRIQTLLKTPKLANEDRLSLEVALERLAENLSLTPASLRVMARLEQSN